MQALATAISPAHEGASRADAAQSGASSQGAVAAHTPPRDEHQDRAAPWQLQRADGWLIAHFDTPQRSASWAMVGGGLTETQDVAWLQVTEADLRPPVNAVSFFQERLGARGLRHAVGLMTSRAVDTFTVGHAAFGAWEAHCLTTVGLGNALRVGDPPGVQGRIGTINTLVHLSAPLSDNALLEALGLACEARTLAVLDAQVPSRMTGELASGTGTDCIVVCAPKATANTASATYVGKHTQAGHVLGQAVLQATRAGIARNLQGHHRTQASQ